MVIHCIYNEREEAKHMIKRLTHHGNSSALIIEKPILELLNISQDTLLEVTTDGSNIIVSPVRSSRREKAFRAALAKVNRLHGKTLKALAK